MCGAVDHDHWRTRSGPPLRDLELDIHLTDRDLLWHRGQDWLAGRGERNGCEIGHPRDAADEEAALVLDGDRRSHELFRRGLR